MLLVITAIVKIRSGKDNIINQQQQVQHNESVAIEENTLEVELVDKIRTS